MKEKKQARRITIFAIILSVIAIGILVFGFILVTSDKVVMLQSMSNIYNKFDKLVENYTPQLNKIANSDKIGIKINYKSGTSKLDLNYLENHSDKKSSLVFSMIENSVPVLDADLLLNNDKLYMFFKDITPTYFAQDMDYNYMLRSISGDDADKILVLIKDSLSSSVSSKDITKEKVTISYNGKDKKVNKITYNVTNKELKQILTEFVDNFKKDTKLVNSITDTFNISKTELLAGLTLMIGQIEENDHLLMTYSTYYYGFNKIVEYDFDIPDAGYTIKYKEEKKENTLDLLMGNIPVLKVVRDKKTDTYTYTTLADPTFKAVYDGKSLNVKMGTSEYDLKIKKVNDYKYSYTLKIKENDVVTTDASFDVELYFDEKIDREIMESVDLNTLTPEEQEQFNQMLESLIPTDTNNLTSLYQQPLQES